MTHYWLMKSEPTSFSIDDLSKRPQQKEPWDGVRNYQARNFLKAMEVGDLAFFYHSSCPSPGIVGFMKIVKSAYPDKSAFDLSDPHYDPKSKKDNPRWFCVDVQLVKKFKHIITLKDLKNQSKLSSMRLLQRGNRLSVMPIASAEWEVVMLEYTACT
ncbi:MAG: EVE domain-containing protein [Pseudomonadota bacterium]